MRSPVSRVAAAAIFVLAILGVALWFHGRRRDAGLCRLPQAAPGSKDGQIQDDHRNHGCERGHDHDRGHDAGPVAVACRRWRSKR